MASNLSRLLEWNPWWSGGKVPPAWHGSVSRSDSAWLLDRLAGRAGTPILLRGPRRVGKTTVIHQVTAGLLAGGRPPAEILYVPLDDPALDLATLFDDIRAANAGKARLYFLDEVTYHPDWARWIKRLIDLRTGAKLLLCSSASALLRKGAGESLAGRVLEKQILPFSASERAAFLGQGNRFEYETGLQLRALWRKFFDGPDPRTLHDDLSKASAGLHPAVGHAAALDYLSEGGFPEYIAEKDPAIRASWVLSGVVDRVLFVDLPQVFGDIGDRAALRDLLRLVGGRGASLFVAESAGSDLGIARQTVSKYLTYLSAAELVRVLEKWSPSAASRARAPRKVLASDPALFASLAGIGPAEARRGGEATGTMAEIAVCTELIRKGAGELFHWRERADEVDFVAAGPRARSGRRPLVAVEVKAGSVRPESKLPGLDAFRRRFAPSVRAEIVVNLDVLDRRGDRVFVPFDLLFE